MTIILAASCKAEMLFDHNVPIFNNNSYLVSSRHINAPYSSDWDNKTCADYEAENSRALISGGNSKTSGFTVSAFRKVPAIYQKMHNKSSFTLSKMRIVSPETRHQLSYKEMRYIKSTGDWAHRFGNPVCTNKKGGSISEVTQEAALKKEFSNGITHGLESRSTSNGIDQRNKFKHDFCISISSGNTHSVYTTISSATTIATNNTITSGSTPRKTKVRTTVLAKIPDKDNATGQKVVLHDPSSEDFVNNSVKLQMSLDACQVTFEHQDQSPLDFSQRSPDAGLFRKVNRANKCTLRQQNSTLTSSKAKHSKSQASSSGFSTPVKFPILRCHSSNAPPREVQARVDRSKSANSYFKQSCSVHSNPDAPCYSVIRDNHGSMNTRANIQQNLSTTIKELEDAFANGKQYPLGPPQDLKDTSVSRRPDHGLEDSYSSVKQSQGLKATFVHGQHGPLGLPHGMKDTSVSPKPVRDMEDISLSVTQGHGQDGISAVQKHWVSRQACDTLRYTFSSPAQNLHRPALGPNTMSLNATPELSKKDQLESVTNWHDLKQCYSTNVAQSNPGDSWRHEDYDGHDRSQTALFVDRGDTSIGNGIPSSFSPGSKKWTTNSGDHRVPHTPWQPCAVCGEAASGNFFGAVVCLPCKSFFIRCTKDGEPCIIQQCQGNCYIKKQLRNRCQYCRYKRCLVVGMSRKEKPECIEPQEGQELCKVCGDLANGIHFGVFTCEGCKKFFRRGLKEHTSYVCKDTRRCCLNPRNRNSCRLCRFQKCLAVGMSREAIKMGRPRKLYSVRSINAMLSYSEIPVKVGVAPSLIIANTSTGIADGRKVEKPLMSKPDGTHSCFRTGHSQFSYSVPASNQPTDFAYYPRGHGFMDERLPCENLPQSEELSGTFRAHSDMGFSDVTRPAQRQPPPIYSNIVMTQNLKDRQTECSSASTSFTYGVNISEPSNNIQTLYHRHDSNYFLDNSECRSTTQFPPYHFAPVSTLSSIPCYNIEKSIHEKSKTMPDISQAESVSTQQRAIIDYNGLNKSVDSSVASRHNSTTTQRDMISEIKLRGHDYQKEIPKMPPLIRMAQNSLSCQLPEKDVLVRPDNYFFSSSSHMFTPHGLQKCGSASRQLSSRERTVLTNCTLEPGCKHLQSNISKHIPLFKKARLDTPALDLRMGTKAQLPVTVIQTGIYLN